MLIEFVSGKKKFNYSIIIRKMMNFLRYLKIERLFFYLMNKIYLYVYMLSLK